MSARPAARFAAHEGFGAVFGGAPEVVARAPGRVNLIGEHTDYNEGLVLPVAISLDTWTAARKLPRPVLRLASRQYPRVIEVALPTARPGGQWTDYVTGTAAALAAAGFAIPGAEIWIESTIPPGAGLSSSAALEIAAGLALLRLGGETRQLGAFAWELALAGQRGEQELAGTQCGFMDQASAVLGRAGSALRLDCRTRGTEYIPLPAAATLAVCHTGVRHELAASEYNQRRRECEAAVAAFRPHLPGLNSLRDLARADLERYGPRLDPILLRRARHVVTENNRVVAACAALRVEDWAALRSIFAASHASLRDDYEVSCPELDAMVAAAGEAPGFLAGRMTGGGFGGCTVNFVRAASAGDFAAAVAAGYTARMHRPATVYLLTAAPSATIEP
ncbi:MAG: galactokinase [Terriglobales bacterium]